MSNSRGSCYSVKHASSLPRALLEHESFITTDTYLPILAMLSTQTKRLPLHVSSVRSCKLYHKCVHILSLLKKRDFVPWGISSEKSTGLGTIRYLFRTDKSYYVAFGVWNARVITTYTLVQLQNRLMTNWNTEKVMSVLSGFWRAFYSHCQKPVSELQ